MGEYPILESQNDVDWKGPQEDISSKAHSQQIASNLLAD